MAGFFVLSGWIVEGKPDLKLLSVTLLGIGTGLILNPYFPEIITSLYYNASRSLFLKASGVQLGVEWSPYDTWSLLKNSLPTFIVFFITILSLPFIKNLKTEEYVSLCMNIVFFILTLKSRRFIEYWPVFAFLSAALIVGRRASTIPLIVGILLLSVLSVFNIKYAVSEIRSSINPERYEGSAKWLIDNTHPAEVVFNADWDDFPFLFFYNHHNYYIVGLDPMYLYTFNQDKSRLYKKITRGKMSKPAQIINREFGARFIFLDRGHRSFRRRLRADPYAEKVYEDRGGFVFEIKPPQE
jgi:hypothetical protein